MHLWEQVQYISFSKFDLLANSHQHHNAFFCYLLFMQGEEGTEHVKIKNKLN